MKGHTAFVNDLHSEDTVYYQACNANFRTGKGIPQLFDDSTQSKPKSKRGRPPDVSRESASLFVANYLKENDDEQTAVNDLLSITQERLKDSSSDAFTSKWLKNRLMEYFKDDIAFTEINGKHNDVTFKTKAKNILHGFYKSRKSDDAEEEKTRIIETAANLLRNEIKECNSSSASYPTTIDIESRNRYKDFLPNSLRLLLEKMFLAKSSNMRTVSIMQEVRPKAIIALLQIRLGVEMHRQLGSRFLIDSLYCHGVCSSNSEVQKCEKSAAVH